MADDGPILVASRASDLVADAKGAVDLRELAGPAEAGRAPKSDVVRVVSGAPRRYRLIGIGQAVTDTLSIITALFLSYLIRFDLPIFAGYLVLLATMPLLWLLVFRGFSLYSPQHLSGWEEFRRLIGASSLGIVLIVMTSFWSKASLSRVWVGLTWLIVLVLELAGRRAWRWLIGRMKADGRLSLRTFIIGADPDGVQLARALAKPGSGFQPVGFITTTKNDIDSETLPVIGGVDDLVPGIYDYGIDCLFIAATDLKQKDLIKLAQLSRQHDAQIRVAAHMPEILSPRLSIQPIEGVMTLAIKPVKLTGSQTIIKRIFDLGAALVGMILVSPILVGTAIAIKLTSRGSIFFKQHRVTKGGHIFTMFKFRTMRNDADLYLKKQGIDSTAPFFKLGEDDPRLTKTGKFLRKFSLDELPQLLNVIRGDMSLVGPRPLPAEQVAANLELLGPRHEVLAGVTGWWQIQGRSEIEDPDEAVRMDLFYIENWSVALDLYVLFKTIGTILKGRGAY